MASVRLSVTIITLNEARNIERCVRSVRDVADEVLVVDSFSTDATKAICARLGVRFLEHSFDGHIEQKQWAVEQATHDHILALDADEALSPELVAAVAAAKECWSHDAYRMNRLTNYCGSWIRHCGWYPDSKIRLWDRRTGRWGGNNPHDRVVMQAGASVGKLRGDLLHYSYHSIEQHVQQIDAFTTTAAAAYAAKGRRVFPVWHFLLYPSFTFLKAYVWKFGFLDGTPGLIVCKNKAYYKLLKYVKLWQLKRR
ncbi:MAG: glycosyltransferase family 2 protein [Catalinimonas sp.]